MHDSLNSVHCVKAGFRFLKLCSRPTSNNAVFCYRDNCYDLKYIIIGKITSNKINLSKRLYSITNTFCQRKQVMKCPFSQALLFVLTFCTHICFAFISKYFHSLARQIRQIVLKRVRINTSVFTMCVY